MMKYAGLVSKASIPQSEPLDDRQVKNNQGGYVYTVDNWKRLERFLILGSDAATYYQSAAKLTRENAKVVEECWVADPAVTAGLIVSISTAGRAPKNDPAIFALALGAVSPDVEARRWALDSVKHVCRTGTHLFQFVATAMALGKGFGRAMKRAVASWYTDKPVDKLAYQVIKYRQREGLTHENLLDMAHPRSNNDEARSTLYDWIIGKKVGDADDAVRFGHINPMVAAHIRAMKIDAGGTRELLAIIEQNPGLPWEALPTWANADPKIQAALLPTMGVTALVRNLGNLTRIGTIVPLSDADDTVVTRLRSMDEIRKSRIHPLQVLTALKVYASGKAVRGDGTWSPSPRVISALDDAFYASFVNVVPTGKRFFIGVDVSASMGAPISGSAVLSCAEAAAALSLVVAKTEERAFIGRFNNGIEPVRYGPQSALDDILRQTRNINGGGTDCSLPMLYALQSGIHADVFVVITDNETRHGRMHPMEALRHYRKQTGIDAKLVVMAMTSTPFTIADPNDAGAMDVVGFDAGMMPVIMDFARQ